jgi:hypothetical protein
MPQHTQRNDESPARQTVSVSCGPFSVGGSYTAASESAKLIPNLRWVTWKLRAYS